MYSYYLLLNCLGRRASEDANARLKCVYFPIIGVGSFPSMRFFFGFFQAAYFYLTPMQHIIYAFYIVSYT